jgi:hypothetical protein
MTHHVTFGLRDAGSLREVYPPCGVPLTSETGTRLPVSQVSVSLDAQDVDTGDLTFHVVFDIEAPPPDLTPPPVVPAPEPEPAPAPEVEPEPDDPGPGPGPIGNPDPLGPDPLGPDPDPDLDYPPDASEPEPEPGPAPDYDDPGYGDPGYGSGSTVPLL